MSRPAYAFPVVFTLVLASAANADPVQPLAVIGGRCECVLATGHPDDQYLLIVGSLAQAGGPFRVSIATEPTSAEAALPLEQPAFDPGWQKHTQQLAEHLAMARQQHPLPGCFTPLAAPPRNKVFHLFVKEGDLQNPASYVAVTAELCGVGQHCQVYIDRDADLQSLKPTIEDAMRTFDNEVFPRALGTALDVDRDGRFTILFSGWLAKMPSGSTKLSGFVRGSDFYRDLAPPFGNRCDMMYLSTDLKPGPYLRTLIAHEYTHGVVFSEHVFGEYLPVAQGHDEHNWLNEAIAHLVENRHGYSWANLDYRLSAYLSAPSRYALVVPDYFSTKLWRDPGTRGCTYLFLRWCVDRFGPELLTRLVQSNLSGVDNLEVATQTRFADLFRQWSAALALSGANYGPDDLAPLTTLNLRDPLASRLLCGPRFEPVKLKESRHEITLAPTSVGYVLLHSPQGPRSCLTVTSGAIAQMQVSIIHLPRLLPRLELQCSASARGDLTISLTAHHAGVTLEHVAWERIVTQEDAANDTSFRPTASSVAEVRRWFGEANVKAGETRHSSLIRLPPGEMVVKVTARDDAGRRVNAWAVVKSAERREGE